MINLRGNKYWFDQRCRSRCKNFLRQGGSGLNIRFFGISCWRFWIIGFCPMSLSEFYKSYNMQKKYFLLLALLSLLSSCITAPTFVPLTETPKSTNRPTIKPEDSTLGETNNKLQIPSASPTINNPAKPAVTPTSTPLIFPNLAEKGSI